MKIQWDNFKSKTAHRIPAILNRAYDSDLYLTLPYSGAYLKRVLTHNRSQPASITPLSIDLAMLKSKSSRATTQFYDSSLSRYCKLQDMEDNIELIAAENPETQSQSSMRYRSIAKEIHEYMQAVEDAYDGNSEKTSAFQNYGCIWTSVQPISTHLYVNIILFQTRNARCAFIVTHGWFEAPSDHQNYVSNRCIQANRSLDIFADPQEGCLADVFFSLGEPQNIPRLNQLQDRIGVEPR